MLLLFLVSFPAMADGEEDLWFAGLRLSNNQRFCSYELSGGKEQKYQKANLYSYGASLGRQFSFLGNLRLRVPFQIEYGSVIEDTADAVPLDDNSVEQLYLSVALFHLGIVPELQVSLPVSSDAEIFFSAGGGVHYVRAREEETIAGNSSVKINDPYLESSRNFSVSADAGAGFEMKVKDKRLSIQYGFRFWVPVNYKTRRDLFPYKEISYKEMFFTHSLQVILLVSR